MMWFLVILLFLVACVQTIRVKEWQHIANKNAQVIAEKQTTLTGLRGEYFDLHRKTKELQHILADHVHHGVNVHVKANTRRNG